LTAAIVFFYCLPSVAQSQVPFRLRAFFFELFTSDLASKLVLPLFGPLVA
jgi:hypothetical protein